MPAHSSTARSLNDHLRRAHVAAEDLATAAAALCAISDTTDLCIALKQIRAAATYASIVQVCLAEARSELTNLGGK